MIIYINGGVANKLADYRCHDKKKQEEGDQEVVERENKRDGQPQVATIG